MSSKENKEELPDFSPIPMVESPNANPKSFVRFDIPYRIADFVHALNEQHITKFTGVPFQYRDIIGYIRKGFMPDCYGGYALESKKVLREIFVIMRKKRRSKYGSVAIHN